MSAKSKPISHHKTKKANSKQTKPSKFQRNVLPLSHLRVNGKSTI